MFFRDLVIALVRVWFSSPSCACGYHRLCVVGGCVVSVGQYLCLDDSNEQSIYIQRQEIKSMVVSMLQN